MNDYEIYVSFGIMHGIIYVKKENAYSLKEEIKSVFEKEYCQNTEPSDEFINEFCEKYHVELPSDIYFDFDDIFNSIF